MASFNLKENAMLQAKGTLAQIPFNTIESCSETLFDLKNNKKNKKIIEEKINFLKNTKLSQMEYFASDEDLNQFVIGNKSRQKRITVSNRASTKGEFRGYVLQKFLDSQKNNSPDSTLFEVISQGITQLKHSDLCSGVRSLLSDGQHAREYYKPPMSEEHFNLFTAIFMKQLQKKISHEPSLAQLTPKQIREDDAVISNLLEGVNLGAIYNASMAFTDHMEQIHTKSDELSKRGYDKAASAANNLYNDLKENISRLFNEEIDLEKFSTHCEKRIEEAKKGELKNHRGVFGKILHSILAVLNKLTFGLISTKPTDVIKKTEKMKDEITKLKSSEMNVESSEKSIEEKITPGK